MKPSELLSAFSERLTEFAEQFSRGNFALWIGSGISRRRVPVLRDLILKMITHLYERAQHPTDGGRFRDALERVIEIAAPSEVERPHIDYLRQPADWAIVNALVSRLAQQYARVLEVQVDGEASDYLVWDAIDVRSTYGDAGLTADADHIAIAILVLEGTAPVLVTANWDPLIERAVSQLCSDQHTHHLSVFVSERDVRGDLQSSILYKIHGCAVRACEEPTYYRELVIARESQIAAWAAKNGVIGVRLQDIALSRRSLVLGLSAQDANIRHIFSAASQKMKWEWPDTPSACMLAAPALTPEHRILLQMVYPAAYDKGYGVEIESASIIGDYAAPVLVALVLYVYYAKLCHLMERALTGLDKALFVAEIRKGIDALRAIAVAAADGAPDLHQYCEHVVALNSNALALFHESGSSSARRYWPLSKGPSQSIGADDYAVVGKMPEFALGLALLGLGADVGAWTIAAPDLSSSKAGALTVVSNTRHTRVFLVSGTDAGAGLYASGRIDEQDDDAVILYATSMPRLKARSPSTSYGRTGKGKVRHVSIKDLFLNCATQDSVIPEFRREAVI